MSSLSNPVSKLIQQWLSRSLAPDQLAWIDEQVAKVRRNEERAFFIAFGMASRKVGKRDLDLAAEDLALADKARSQWNPSNWTTDQAARTQLVLALPCGDVSAFGDSLDKLFAAADVGELVALYQMLPLLPHPEIHVKRAAEGVRTNIKTVLCAVAHHNPFPAERLDKLAWNQMVLKCLFVGAALDPIIGLDERAGADLARMLVDYAHERWSAGRSVSPELWRCVGPFADEQALRDLRKVLTTGTDIEQQGAVLALLKASAPEAKDVLKEKPELAVQARQQVFSWHTIADAISER